MFLSQKIKTIAALCLLAGVPAISQAAVYVDATNELFTTGAPQLDISSVVATNDSANLYFTIKLIGNPILTNWGSYAIALMTGSGGATNGNGSGAAISNTKGINYWATCLGWGDPQLWQYNAGTSNWTSISGVVFANNSNSVSLTVPFASIGLASGSSFQFDAYTFSGTGGPVDDLANPAQTIYWWSDPYTNNLVENYSSMVSTHPAYSWTYYDATNDLFTTNAVQFDISSVIVSNDASNLCFIINVMGNPTTINWDNYAIAFTTGPGGAINGNPSGALIANTTGINYWATCQGSGSPQLWQYRSNTQSWTNIGGASFANTSSSVSLTVPYASLGLTSGETFQFDAYTFSGTGGALDDLANPGWASSWWNVSYSSSLIETYPMTGSATNNLPVSRGGLTAGDSPTMRISSAGGALSVFATNILNGTRYIMESTSNLALATWTPISTNISNGNPITNVMAIDASVAGVFFRSKVEGVSTTIHTVGDSTVQIWPTYNYPKKGWGQLINYFFNPTNVTIDDVAVGGTSSKSFYSNYWAGVKSKIQPGDFVFIQFGINDGNTNPAIFTDPQTTFKSYLTTYVNETKALGAYPVLITPMRAAIGNTGSPYGTYAVSVRELAVALAVPLIDLDVLSGALIYSDGTNYASQYLYMNLPAGVYSNYPTGNSDNTHFQEMGAIAMAKLVIQGIHNLGYDTNICKLIPSLAPTYPVNFSSGGAAGLVTLSNLFPAGITITAKAVANTGYAFTGWSGDLNSQNAVTTFIMGSVPKNITASFSPQ